jgi:hypothetical protein
MTKITSELRRRRPATVPCSPVHKFLNYMHQMNTTWTHKQIGLLTPLQCAICSCVPAPFFTPTASSTKAVIISSCIPFANYCCSAFYAQLLALPTGYFFQRHTKCASITHIHTHTSARKYIHTHTLTYTHTHIFRSAPGPCPVACFSFPRRSRSTRPPSFPPSPPQYCATLSGQL